ncbi:response regulator [Rhodopirellula sp.]|nr:HD domain-containing phosphohydrolase [Rhodopirellula sp.]MDB4679055.1 response regulator [Rhodopirellula sp.]
MTIERKINRNACVTIIDDERINIEVVKAYLAEAGFGNFESTTDARDAISLMDRCEPDILLLDINMPHVSGLEILATMRQLDRYRLLPVLVLTAAEDPEIKLEALRLGASDFLAKPVDPSELTLRLENVLAVKAYQDHLAKHSEMLEERVRERTRELEESRREAIHCLARAGEYRDDDTGNHVTRVGRYTGMIAEELGFSRDQVELIEQAAKLHDVGKIGIPDAILHKAGKLDAEEYEIIQQHCGIGLEIMNPTSGQIEKPGRENGSQEDAEQFKQHASLGPTILGSTHSPLLRLASVIAGSHHEKWDGSGYPRGLKGESIPLEGRIVAIADVFDALSSPRSYKEAFCLNDCINTLEQGRGKHFDPRVLDAFMRRQPEIIAVQNQFMELHG